MLTHTPCLAHKHSQSLKWGLHIIVAWLPYSLSQARWVQRPYVYIYMYTGRGYIDFVHLFPPPPSAACRKTRGKTLRSTRHAKHHHPFAVSTSFLGSAGKGPLCSFVVVLYIRMPCPQDLRVQLRVIFCLCFLSKERPGPLINNLTNQSKIRIWSQLVLGLVIHIHTYWFLKECPIKGLGEVMKKKMLMNMAGPLRQMRRWISAGFWNTWNETVRLHGMCGMKLCICAEHGKKFCAYSPNMLDKV